MTNDIGPRYEALCEKKPELKVDGVVVCTLPGVEMWGRLDAGCVDTYHRLTRDEAHSLIAMRMIEQLPDKSALRKHKSGWVVFEGGIDFFGQPMVFSTYPTIIECLLAFWEAQP